MVRTRLDPHHPRLPGVGAGPVGESGIDALTHAFGFGGEDSLPAVGGKIMVGHLKPLVSVLALADALDLLVNRGTLT